MNRTRRTAQEAYNDPEAFALHASGRVLRSYQREVLRAVVRSIRARAGRSFVVIFSRQSGKNELQAQLFTYLLAVLSGEALNIVSVSPTYKPQTLNAMSRLEAVLERNVLTRRAWRRSAGYKVQLGRAQVIFLSGDPTASVVGETAHVLLSIDEAQDVLPERFDKAFAPMSAAHNATRVFWGTSWTSATLLAREKRAALAAEQADGIRRVWIVPGDVVAGEVPAYAAFLQDVTARMGRDHPIVRTQYYCEEIEAQGGMFNPRRLALMLGDRPAQETPTPGELYAFCLDAAGQDEAIMAGGEGALENPGRDAVSLSILGIDLSTLATLQAPTYRILQRRQWIGENHLTVFGQVKALAEAWRPQHIVIDATGVGEGLWAMLEHAFPGRVLPVRFNREVKSGIGWKLISIIETGRLRDCCPTDAVRAQYLACQSEILPGPARTLRWGVPEGARSADGARLHDDYLLADALAAKLDGLDWKLGTEFYAIEGEDPLKAIPEDYF